MFSLKVPTWFRRGAEVGSIAAAVFVVGISYGSLARSAGLPIWLTIFLAIGVLAASSELLFVAAITAGASPVIAAVGALIINLRNGVYGVEASGYLGNGWRRWLGAHLVNDETVAYAATRSSTVGQRRAFWTLGIAILSAWPLGAVLAVGGSLVAVIVQPYVVAGIAPMLGLTALLPVLIRQRISRG